MLGYLHVQDTPILFFWPHKQAPDSTGSSYYAFAHIAKYVACYVYILDGGHPVSSYIGTGVLPAVQ